MSGRCRSCDCIMSDDDMRMRWPDSTEYSDLCGYCFHIALDPDNTDYELDPELPEGFQLDD